MYAVLYGNSEMIRLLLDCGADVNVYNDAGATALMWAVGELETTQLLLRHGADVNARSNDGRTSIIIAADRFGAAAVVKALLAIKQFLLIAVR